MCGDSLVAQIVKNILAMQETSVSFLGGEDLQEKRMATSILAWRIPWAQEPGRLYIYGVTRSWTQLKWLNMHAQWETGKSESMSLFLRIKSYEFILISSKWPRIFYVPMELVYRLSTKKKKKKISRSSWIFILVYCLLIINVEKQVI